MQDEMRYGSVATEQLPQNGGQFVDEFGSESPATQQKKPSYSKTSSGEGQLVVEEVAGQAPAGYSSTESAESSGDHDEVGAEGTESGEEFVEASPAEMSESSEYGESAVSDLESVEGFESQPYQTGEGVELLPDAGSATGQESAEFFPLLAKLVPLIGSVAAPAIKGAIKRRLKPKTKQKLQNLAKGAPGLMALLAKLLGGAETGEETFESTTETAVDAAIAEEAAQMLEVIIGTDDRVRIRNTTRIPWRRLCALRITMKNGKVYRGSGFFVGPRAVVTAGHCVFLHDQGGWARQIEVIPAADGSKKPYGSVTARSFRSVKGWVNSRKPENDYGCIVLPSGAFSGRVIGSFGFGPLTDSQLLAKQAVLAGYPGDKPFAELWGMSRRIKSVSSSKLIYDIDTMGGQSGSPVYVKQGNNRCVVGIHNYGSSSGNSATRVNAAVVNNMKRWHDIGRGEAASTPAQAYSAASGW